MTVIGIISDTHGQLSEAAYAALADSTRATSATRPSSASWKRWRP